MTNYSLEELGCSLVSGQYLRVLVVLQAVRLLDAPLQDYGAGCIFTNEGSMLF